MAGSNGQGTAAVAGPRVVITGMGALTPIGNSAEEYWRNLVAGVSGIGPITQFDPKDLRSRSRARSRVSSRRSTWSPRGPAGQPLRPVRHRHGPPGAGRLGTGDHRRERRPDRGDLQHRRRRGDRDLRRVGGSLHQRRQPGQPALLAGHDRQHGRLPGVAGLRHQGAVDHLGRGLRQQRLLVHRRLSYAAPRRSRRRGRGRHRVHPERPGDRQLAEYARPVAQQPPCR